jgi:hypothetical protein
MVPGCVWGESINSKRGKEPKAGAGWIDKKEKWPTSYASAAASCGGPRKLPGPSPCHVGLAVERVEGLAVAVGSMDNPPFLFFSLCFAAGCWGIVANAIIGWLVHFIGHWELRSAVSVRPSSASQDNLSRSAPVFWIGPPKLVSFPALLKKMALISLRFLPTSAGGGGLINLFVLVVGSLRSICHLLVARSLASSNRSLLRICTRFQCGRLFFPEPGFPVLWIRVSNTATWTWACMSNYHALLVYISFSQADTLDRTVYI